MYNLSPTQPDFGISYSPLPKSNVNSFKQNGSYVQLMHKAEHRLQNDDIKLACSAREQFHEEFSFKNLVSRERTLKKKYIGT